MDFDDEETPTPRRPSPVPTPKSKPKPTRQPAAADPDALPPRAPAPERQTFQAAPNPTEADKARPRRPRSDREPNPERGGGPNLFERLVFGSVSSHHLALFCRQFSSYTDAGVDLIKSLNGLKTQFARTALGPVLGRLQDAVRQGDNISDAMNREPQAFDKLFLSMMRVAESRGGVPETLRSMADHYEARVRMIRQARSAMIYPVIVMFIAFGVMLLISIFVLPKFADLLKDIAGRSGGDLPFASRALMAISSFMTGQGWWLVPLTAFGSIFALFRFYATKPGKTMLDEMSLYIPVLGALLRKIDTTRFARTLSVLLEAGVDIGSSLKLTSEVMRLAPYQKAIRTTRTLVMDGSELSEALRQTNRFTPDVMAIIESGEESGKVPLSLEKLADDYEEQVEYTIKNLGQLVQPLIMVMLGFVVLFIILAVIMPYISMITSLTR